MVYELYSSIKLFSFNRIKKLNKMNLKMKRHTLKELLYQKEIKREITQHLAAIRKISYQHPGTQ